MISITGNFRKKKQRREEKYDLAKIPHKEITMIKYIIHIFKVTKGWLKLIHFLRRVNSIERILEDGMYRCGVLMEETSDRAFQTDMRAILHKIEYARLRMRSIRERGTDLILLEDEDCT
jgi:hypothetical protein